MMRAISLRSDDVDIVGEAEDAEQALELIKIQRPDVLVLDWLMPGMSGLELIHKIRSLKPVVCPRVLLCTAHANSRLLGELFSLGVHGFVDKSQVVSIIEVALVSVMQGGLFFASSAGPAPSPYLESSPVSNLPGELSLIPPDALSTREREVAGLVAAGYMSKEIAARLGIALRTVESHRAHIMDKLGVSSVPTLTRWCVRTGLIEG